MNKLCFSALLLILICGCSENKITQLRVSSFNIRLDTEVDNENRWDYRKERVYDYIKDSGFDIVGMQEVKHNQLVDLNSGLSDYSYVGVGRDDGKAGGEYSPIYFKTGKYKLIESDTFWLSETPDSIGKKGWDAACARVATWARLEDKQTAKRFIVVNTHLDHKGKMAQQESAKLIVRKITELSNNDPIILTGDFNVTEDDKAYASLTTGDLSLLDTYKISDKITGVKTSFHDYSRIPEQDRVKIDFIFVSEGINVLKCDITKECPEKHISDHNPYYSDLEF